MMIPSVQGARAEQQLDERFIELIVADDELMQAEFDDIVAAEWAVPPALGSTCEATADGRGTRGHRRRELDRSRSSASGPARASSGLVFARSPPRAL
jgi:hypothetical protein